MGDSPLHAALAAVTKRLDAMGLPYALAGAMAMYVHGFQRLTLDIDLVLTADGLARFKAEWLGRGYVEPFPGSRGMRDTEHDIPIDVLVSGGYPGDGKRKPVRFGDPAAIATTIDGIRVLTLERLVEWKLASGLSAPHRGGDLIDVLRLIRAKHLDEGFADRLDSSVRAKYLELVAIARNAPVGDDPPLA